MNSEKEAVWSVTSLPGWWDWGVSSQDPGVSRASGAAVGLVVVGVESTSWSWAPGLHLVLQVRKFHLEGSRMKRLEQRTRKLMEALDLGIKLDW